MSFTEAYGVFSVDGSSPRIGFASGEAVHDLRALADAGALDHGGLAEVCRADDLLPLLAAGPEVWSGLRSRLADVVGSVETIALDGVTMHLPFPVRDFVDFYSSIEHATNLGRILRPDGEPLLANWRHLPVGYHGRSSTVVVSGTPVRRPAGQSRPDPAGPPVFGSSQMLDFELEVGFVTGGPDNRMGEPLDVSSAEDSIFGLVLVNDWSARDIQAWEYQPLGPFLGKSFATSISPWVVPLAALSSFRVPGPVQSPPPLPHLQASEPRGLDLSLEVWLRTPSMSSPVRISSTSFAGVYWSMAQQLAHLTSNGAVVGAGDLCASGTVSGAGPGSEGSLMELTWRGSRPLVLPNGETRGFLEDGDEVTMTGWCGDVGFGSVVGRVVGLS
ncbi:MAG: fumarylacetoacetase [Actinomycetota bacterium]|nr:fumarylacetoacetase [Actinomycetota bacterium]